MGSPGCPPVPALHASAGERAEPGAAHPLISAAWEAPSTVSARGLWAGFSAWEVLVVTSWQLRHLPFPAGTAERGFPPVPLACSLSSLRAPPMGLAPPWEESEEVSHPWPLAVKGILTAHVL